MDGTLVEPTRMRAAISRRMVESKREAPHFYVQTEVAVSALLAALAQRNEDPSVPRATVTVALARACVVALREHPRFNSVWTPEGLLEVDPINLGVAIAIDDGLLAPALLDAGSMGPSSTAIALRDLTERARAGRLKPAEISAATFTLSNLGMFDVTAYSAIIPPPQVAILATARAVERWAIVDGAPSARTTLTATLSADHRAVDGVDAARFLGTFKQAMEEPQTLLAELDETKEAGA
jgi:pyruvate dehydrogenase E2 component (dihydrolipoamide acetyltransferase)